MDPVESPFATASSWGDMSLVQAPQPRHTIHDDFRQITKLPAKPTASPTLQPTTCMSTIPASNQPTPEPPWPMPNKYSSHCHCPSSQHSTMSYSGTTTRCFCGAPTDHRQPTAHPCERISLESSHTQTPTPQDSIGIEETHELKQEKP